MTPLQAADLRLRQAAERLQRANAELAAAEREHSEAAWIVDAQQFLAEQFPEPTGHTSGESHGT